MQLKDFTAFCKSSKIEFELDGENLRTSAPKGVLTKDTIELIKQFKPMLVGWLSMKSSNDNPEEEEPEVIEGIAPVLPNAHMILNRSNPSYWNCSTLYELGGLLNSDALKSALSSVLMYHDGLRRVFQKNDDGWVQKFQNFEELSDWWSVESLSSLDDESASRHIEEVAQKLQRSLDVEKCLVKIVFFDLGENRNSRLLFIIHHFLIDQYSYPLLLQDLFFSYVMISGGAEVEFQEKTTSIKKLANVFSSQIHNNKDKYREMWLGKPWDKYLPLPIISDSERELAIKEEIESVFTLTLDRENSLALNDIQKKQGVSQLYILVSAMYLAYEKVTGSSALFLMLFHHGRLPRSDSSLDLTRTIGWLSNFTPVYLYMENNSVDYSDLIKQVKHLIESEVEHEISYNYVNFMDKEAYIPAPQLQLNYIPEPMLEDKEKVVEFGDNSIRTAPESVGDNDEPIEDDVAPGVHAQYQGDQLSLKWSFNPKTHSDELVREIALSQIEFIKKIIST